MAGAGALIITATWAAVSTGQTGNFTDAGGVAQLLAQHSRLLGALYAILLLDASIIGAAAVTLATSYAFGDMFNMRHSLHRGLRDAKPFYAMFSALVIGAAAVVLIPGAPLGLITTSVQALAGLLLPSASVFLLLLCNDREVLGPWVNSRWLNALAALIIAVLLLLSGVLMATTLFPGLNVTLVTVYLAVAFTVLGGLAVVGLAIVHRRGQPATPQPAIDKREKLTWRMPQLALLRPVQWSPGLKLGMLTLRVYLVISAVLLIVKAVQLGTH